MAQGILFYVAVFGTFTVAFLWLRDVRIFARTAYSGYRTASYRGVLYTALSLAGLAAANFWSEFVGVGLVLLALYLQGEAPRETNIWTGETATERFFGSVRRRTDKASQ
ncbi:MAG: ABC transporter permease [Methanomicrobiaceae archaeon]|nr:ABC transporter permease [Methanomicrobiaceae archaeon]